MKSYRHSLVGRLRYTIILAAASILTHHVSFAQNDIVYRLSSFDKISISVYGEPDLSTEQLVSDDGFAFLPLLGKVKVEGQTISEASENIEKAFIAQEYLRKPVVTVSIEEFSPKVASILGEVKTPGSVLIAPGKNGIPLAVAVAEAGGFTGSAKTAEIRITRSNSKTTGKPTSTVVNMGKAFGSKSDDDDSEPLVVYAGDIVFVPRRVF